MALLADQSAEVNSNLVGGAGSQSKRFTMPGGVAIKVESVVATVSNGAGSAVTPELTIRDQSGVVIATTKQDASIPAGDTGTATYALRLNGNFGTAAGFIKYGVINSGNWLEIHTTTNLAPGSGGINLTAPKGGVWIVSQGEADSQFLVFADFVHFVMGGFTFRVSGSDLFDIDATDAFFNSGSSWGVDSPQIYFDLTQVGATLTVQDHNGQAIFRIDENGDLHGKTGKALVFDL